MITFFQENSNVAGMAALESHFTFLILFVPKSYFSMDAGQLTTSVSLNVFIFKSGQYYLTHRIAVRTHKVKYIKHLVQYPAHSKHLNVTFLLRNYTCIPLADVSTPNFGFQSPPRDGWTQQNLHYFLPYLTFKLASLSMPPGIYTFLFPSPSLSIASRPNLSSVFSMKPFPVN